MIMSRNSRPQSSSPAGTTPGSASRSSSPRTSTPASTRSVRNGRALGLEEGAVDQQAFRRAADAGAAGLGVQDHPPRLREVGGPVDVDVHDALEMGEDRDPRLGLHPADEALAAARHDARR